MYKRKKLLKNEKLFLCAGGESTTFCFNEFYDFRFHLGSIDNTVLISFCGFIRFYEVNIN